MAVNSICMFYINAMRKPHCNDANNSSFFDSLKFKCRRRITLLSLSLRGVSPAAFSVPFAAD